MTPELGHLALILALLISIVQGVLPRRLRLRLPDAGLRGNDFSVSYVAEHSNSKLPTAYRAAAVWGGHEGSLLLWLLMLNGWAFAVSLLSRQLPQAMVARVLGVMGLVGMGFLLFMLLTSNPFDRLLPPAADGAT
jgi:cytochrome c-type biogenesis protein CcmF